jgi:site-specific recombinase XerD
MLLQQAIEDFITGYFSTHERSPKTRSAYRSDLDQVAAYANTNQMLMSLDGGRPTYVSEIILQLR